MKKKVEITIENSKYDKSHKGGKEYFSVGFSASHYGAGSPCDNEEEVRKAIESQKDWIRREGDIPIVIDLRKQTPMKQLTLIEMKGGGE